MTVYAEGNPRTKKAFKEAVAAGEVRVFQAGLGPDLTHFTGRQAISGPHYPKPHSWYADCDLVDGKVVKVR